LVYIIFSIKIGQVIFNLYLQKKKILNFDLLS